MCHPNSSTVYNITIIGLFLKWCSGVACNECVSLNIALKGCLTIVIEIVGRLKSSTSRPPLS